MDDVPAPMLRRFGEVRRRTEWLCEPLAPEDHVVQSMPDASPARWHLAHTAWFFEEFVLGPRGVPPLDARYAYLFNSYYEAVGPRWERSRRGVLSRPTVAEILAWRHHVDARMADLLAGLDAGALAALHPLLELGLAHEEQHQELILTDGLHAFWTNPLRPSWRAPEPLPAMPEAGWIPQPEAIVSLGHDGPGFCFDNERPRHRALVPAFGIAARPTSAGEYAAFIADGGYRRPELWMSDGWAAATAGGWRAPLYWERRDGAWWTMSLSGMRAVDPAEPVCHVCWFEADAFARWAGARLPTEAEWESAAATGGLGGTGAVWEWTGSAYAPYPGYRPAAGALGEYNGKFMCGQFVLRGGSQATPPGHARPTYRNFFPPAARWQFAGIRLARDAS